MNKINLLKPKARILFKIKDLDFSNYKKPRGFKVSDLGRLSIVYSAAFALIILMLNFPILFQRGGYVMNNFTDRDEILETQLLSDYYHSLEEKKRLVIPVEAEENLVFEDSLYIPKTNIRAPIIVGQSSDGAAVLEDLKKGVVMYPGSSMPGKEGSTVILGHSSSNLPWNDYSSVFSLLQNLEVGDLIYVKYRNEFFVYSVGNKLTGSVFTLSKADLSGDLVLSSCWPVGSDKGRIVIVSNLISRFNDQALTLK